MIVVAANTVTLLFGSFVTAMTLRAYRRTGSRALFLLGVGFGLVTLGSLVGGALHQVTGASLVLSVAVHSVFTAAGFLAVSYSLYVEHGPGEPVPTRP